MAFSCLVANGRFAQALGYVCVLTICRSGSHLRALICLPLRLSPTRLFF